MQQRFSKKLIPLFLFLLFLLITIPASLKRPTGGRSGERQGQTAGMIRIFCQDPSWNFIKGPQVHYGNNPFNLEFPLFEWTQGHIARLIDGPECNSVESVAKTISALFGALGIVGLFLLGSQVFGTLGGFVAALLLCTNELWIRYSTYSMIDSRMLTCGIFAILFSVLRLPVAGGIMWSLTMMQKPQSFAFLAPLWLGLELIILKREGRKFSYLFKDRKRISVLLGFIAAIVVGYSYYLWSVKIDTESDLPWVTWMGPRARLWFMGDWSARFEFSFYYSLLLDTFKRTYLNIVIPFFFVLFLFIKKNRLKKSEIGFLILIPFAYFFAKFCYMAVFYNVVVVHEYYSLPLNVGASLLAGGLIATSSSYLKGKFRQVFLLGFAVILSSKAFSELKKYREYFVNIENSKDWRYDAEWNVEIFPDLRDKKALVVMAGPGSGRDILPLYFTKKHGFAWCAQNERFAPRAYWKEQNVQYVAWWKEYDSKNRMHRWTVRTIDEELARARKNGWSSDEQDVWENRTMTEWASFASNRFLDPCSGPDQMDPRSWKD